MTELLQDCYLSKSRLYSSQTIHIRRDYPDLRAACRQILDDVAARLAFFKENPNLAKAALNQIGISPYFNDTFESELAQDIALMAFDYSQPAQDYLRFEEIAHFAVTGTYAIYRHWFQTGMEDKIERVTKCAVYCGVQVLSGAGGQPINPDVLTYIDEWEWSGMHA